MYQIDLKKETYSLGTSLTIEALKSMPYNVKKVFLSSKANKNNQLDLLVNLCNLNNIDVEYDDDVINKYSLKENCYCIGVIKRFNSELNDDNHIVLYNFKDIGQLGTIFRSAVSFNLKNFILINTNIDLFDPRVVRASMGAIFHIHFNKYDSLDSYLNEYHNNIYAYLDNSYKELSSIKINKPYSIVIAEDFKEIDNLINCGFYIKHQGNLSPSISAVSSIVFHYFYKNLFR